MVEGTVFPAALLLVSARPKQRGTTASASTSSRRSIRESGSRSKHDVLALNVALNAGLRPHIRKLRTFRKSCSNEDEAIAGKNGRMRRHKCIIIAAARGPHTKQRAILAVVSPDAHAAANVHANRSG
jgi:hypothetical protein